MAAKSHEKLIEEIGGMSVLELSELVKALEEKFGVSAAMPVAGAAAPGATAGAESAQATEKAEYKVTLKEVGSDRVAAIKLVKQFSGLSLGEAKSVVENAPGVILEAAPKEKAQEIKQKLEESGAKVELS